MRFFNRPTWQVQYIQCKSTSRSGVVFTGAENTSVMHQLRRKVSTIIVITSFPYPLAVKNKADKQTRIASLEVILSVVSENFRQS